MNEAIRDSLEVLFSTCVELGAAGKLWVHCSYSPHVDSIEVYAHPNGHDYCADKPEPPIFCHGIYLSGELASNPIAKIHALIDTLNAYRQEDAA